MKSSLTWSLAALSLVASTSVASAQNRFAEHDLVSDVPGLAAATDSDLVNPWGLVPGPTGIFWVSANGSGKSTLYNPSGGKVPLVVTIPGGAPTGIVVTSAAESSFAIPSGDSTARALFIFASEAGTITAWTNTVHPESATTVATTPGAIYKGLAQSATPDGPRLYAANFHAGTIDVFDRHFQPVPSVGFHDASIPAGYGPFNLAVLGGELFVSYAKQDSEAHDDVAGPGLGFIDVYDLRGNFVRHLASNGNLDAPWGMVLAPPGFGSFAGKLLVGNFGDGQINVFDPAAGTFLGRLQDSTGSRIAIDGLWGLFATPPAGPGTASRLYFTAGIQDEAHGLFGYLGPATAAAAESCSNRSLPLSFWLDQIKNQGGHGRDDDDDDDAALPADGHHEKKKEHHHPPQGISADSLRTLFDCISNSSLTFAGTGCFEPGINLLEKKDCGPRESAARAFLVLLLNRCAGLICDSTGVSCGGDGDHDGDDFGPGQGIHRLADLIALLDSSLCNPHPSFRARDLEKLAECAIDGPKPNPHHNEGEMATPAPMSRAPLEVASLGGNPMRL